MVAGNVVGFYTLAHPAQNVLYDFHVAFWPISFTKLPYIDDVAIQY